MARNMVFIPMRYQYSYEFYWVDRLTMNARAKTINLLLYDGSLQGVISIEDSSWNSGEMYSAPRESVEDLLATDACSKYGVYLLLSVDRVYVGQSSDLAKRLSQHIIGKDWWESAIILTTKDDSLNHTDIDYLESILIDKAFVANKLDCDNKKKGNPPKVDRFRKVFLGQYLEEALFLMQLIGITVFSDGKQRQQAKRQPSQPIRIATVDVKTQLAIGKRAKSQAIAYLKSNSVEIGEHVSYAVLQENGLDFWINPQTKLLSQDWQIILNDNSSHELIVLSIPKESIPLRADNPKGLATRADKPYLIDLTLSRKSLIDRRSKYDFSPYVAIKLPY